MCLMAHASLTFMALTVLRLQKKSQKVCGLKNNPHICSAKQLNMFVMYVERG